MQKRCRCKPIRCRDIPIKRYFLPFSGVIFLGFIPEVRAMYYLPIVVFITCFIIFWNFPKIVILPTIRPTYIDDLFTTESRDRVSMGIPVMIKNKYYSAYIWSLIVTSSILFAGLSDYWLTKVDFNNDTLMTTLGTIGGVMSIYFMINKIIAKSVLFFMKRNIKKEEIVYKKHFNERLEMLSVLNDEFKDICSDALNSKDILDKIKEENIKNNYHGFQVNSFMRPNRKTSDLTEVIVDEPYYIAI